VFRLNNPFRREDLPGTPLTFLLLRARAAWPQCGHIEANVTTGPPQWAHTAIDDTRSEGEGDWNRGSSIAGNRERDAAATIIATPGRPSRGADATVPLSTMGAVRTAFGRARPIACSLPWPQTSTLSPKP